MFAGFGLDTRRNAGRVKPLFLVIDDGELFDAEGLHLFDDAIDVQPAFQRLAAGHGDRVIVEDLVGHVGVCGDGGADRLSAGMCVGPVAELLEDVLGFRETALADPVHALAAHMGVAEHIAPHPLRHVMAADPGVGAGPFRHLGGGVVRASRAEPWRAFQRRLDIGAVGGAFQRLDPAGVQLARHAFIEQNAAELKCDIDGRKAHLDREKRLAVLVPLADHARAGGVVKEDFLDLAFDQATFFLNDDDQLQTFGPVAQARRLQRVDHAWFVDGDAHSPGGFLVNAKKVQRMGDVEPAFPR